jgi:hypothetical protein
MGNKITTLSISELLEKDFYVPAYQRGYRWTEQQVIDLMDDIYSFAIKKNKSQKEFYCLQPIILKKRQSQGSDVYEVIDGYRSVLDHDWWTYWRVNPSVYSKAHPQDATYWGGVLFIAKVEKV